MKKIDIACIIDDDPIFVFGVKKVMQLADVCTNFLIYRNGKEALDALTKLISDEEKLPDVILLDLNMPILDGWQFLDEFIKVPVSKKITVYIVSSSVDPKDVLRAKSYSIVNNYIVKPITMKKLVEAFSKVHT
ncbi:response regulator [Aquimarina spongiae]|uniref:Response regulator receiver domain-containing protein n=1 Tax=Aquimarina spongiae TaxID=570521 RepID=A0A1M6GQF0_9FLAO|nr:response regulator [Aquimarina spongiae]SHJ12165.1 Response regulator receiver domain-containing protein [Aquimarina spongiae]